MNKIQKLKETVSRIDIGKLADYSEKNPNSKTLRQIIRYSKRILDSENEEVISKLAVSLGYNFDTIVNVSKYVKNEKEKKF
jgi:predicted Ser/Thr protein kinase